ncbi:hypothetical protein [Burkholderia aenigmatica]|uniref:hypothetical protein n=1 Tax=Burkholderia aenigmatica TaxID=2015348 RepID=UPI002656ECFE|nr:hypothetical protein [Burkholderia aenigmatica]MDN7880115.1 hypothetical protein [Burkholderia aenigmatica]
MRSHILISAITVMTLAGCVSTAQYGDFSNGSSSIGNGLASDMVEKLSADYPPARTRLNVEQPTQDAFGSLFVSRLRSKGFAVAELNQPDMDATGKPRDELRRAAHPYFFRAPAPAQTTVDMRYVVDQLGVDSLYRVTIWLGDKSVSRAYVAQGTDVSPIGAWVRKE